MKVLGHDKDSYQCCGVGVYRPDKQTCCLESRSIYRIHDDKPERHHICCSLDVYARRSTSAPCQHISRNDAFLSNKLPKLETNYLKHSITKALICSKTFAFYVRIAKEKGYGERLFLKARITQYRRDEKHLWHVQKRHKFIMLDKYSSGRLGRKGFIIFSNYDYLDDVIFIRRDVDTVFKAPKRKRMLLKRLRKVYSTCRSNKS
ncbi:uncharacterized protein LOC132733452 [Ruditapes philippinarum]|uniref:uncharacterized protein LOC132733452 n=1 Tax=Ruditapes philippinarum TaxID=129788 RepID=UPI00295ACF4F|nr:uncharacterized protein LOC132733452 [Ruditapes philippinarum]